MRTTAQLGIFAVLAATSGPLLGQATPGTVQTRKPATVSAAQEWDFNLTVDGYIIPDGTSYVNPVFTADHKWLHMEGRYNYENLRMGSLWFGYNTATGTLIRAPAGELDVAPMIGGVFGRTNGIAPGLEVTLNFKNKIEASLTNEYVFDTTSKSGNFYYAWPQLTYSPLGWLQVGAVAQHTVAYHTPVSIQRGFLVGVSHNAWELTTYVFNPGISGTTVVLELGVSFKGP